MEKKKLSNDVVLRGIVERLLSKANRRAIMACARRSLGDARDLKGIRAVARRHKANPAVVLAAFGFLQVLGDPDHFVDVTDTSDAACETAALPDDKEAIATFALARWALGRDEICPLAY